VPVSPAATTRAQEHADVGDALIAAADNEWAAVCYFYAAYQLAIAAISDDPIFDDLQRLQGVNAELLPDDRHTTRHKGRKNTSHGREWGVNELMLLLYGQAVGAAYEKLHHASVCVRYEPPLRTPPARAREWLDVILAAEAAGELVCTK
jgi:hypothetical protein